MSEELHPGEVEQWDQQIPNPAQYGPAYGKSTRRFKALRKRFRADCEAVGEPCWACWLGKPAIDYSLPREHPHSFNLDHAIPVSVRPDLAEDPANFRASHRICNEKRGAGAPALTLGKLSRDW